MGDVGNIHRLYIKQINSIETKKLVIFVYPQRYNEVACCPALKAAQLTETIITFTLVFCREIGGIMFL